MTKNTELVERWFQDVWCAPYKPETIDELLADDAKLNGIDPDGPMTKDDFKQIRQHFLLKFPDINIQVTHCVEMGNYVAFHARVSGTHVDSQRQVTFMGTAVAEFRDGQVIGSHETWDFASMLVQCGALPEAVVAQELRPA